jgi:hypothetical protein
VTDLLFTATSGVRLPELDALEMWRQRVTALQTNGHSAADWFIALAVLSADDTNVRNRKKVKGSEVAAYLGVRADPIYSEGSLFTLYNDLAAAFRMDTDGANADKRLYEQARAYTFLAYRDGLVRLLARIPFTAEATVHAYVRVVLEWARTWRGLTRASDNRPSDSQTGDAGRLALATEALPPEALAADARKRAHIALPLVVAHDVRALIRMFSEREADRTEPEAGRVFEDVAVETVLAQLEAAVVQLVEDASLSALTAGNLVRPSANRFLGGALLRTRKLTPETTALLGLVYEHLVATHDIGTSPLNVLEAVRRADAEKGFANLKKALRAFGSATEETGDN